jgi:ubiquinone/menaquinone biosynthesis C-methylase UbiE
VLIVLAAAVGAAALWWRKNPSACPYGQRFWVEMPHPLITRARLREALDPKPGERILEVGPGTGYYAVPVAGWLAPGGTLELLDLQREMLDHTLRRAAQERVDGIVATQADATRMPYEDASLDGAYLVLVLGEIPDQEAALRELHRVVRPGGRVVVGELFGDPHWVAPGALERRGEAAGLRLERRLGTPLGYFARFARS